MEFIKYKDTLKFQNSPGCVATEYDFRNENDFNIAGIKLDGRYPEKGYALNTVSKELIYVKNGNGVLASGSRSIPLEPGDAVLIQPHEKYYIEGTLELIISSAPAWHPEQHQNVSD